MTLCRGLVPSFFLKNWVATAMGLWSRMKEWSKGPVIDLSLRQPKPWTPRYSIPFRVVTGDPRIDKHESIEMDYLKRKS